MSPKSRGIERQRGNTMSSNVYVSLPGLISILMNLMVTEIPEPGFSTLMWLASVLIFVVGTVLIVRLKFRRVRRSLVASLGFFLLGFIIFTAIILPLSVEQADEAILFGLALWFVAFVTAVGSVIAGRGGKAKILSTVPADIIDSFQQIKPDRILKTRNFTVLKKKDIYILITELVRAVYFVRLSNQTPALEKDVKLPIIFIGKTKFKNEIGGLPMAKAMGEIVIPVDVVRSVDNKIEARYIKGAGIEYVFPTQDVRPGKPESSDLTEKFDRTTLLKILEELSEEASQPMMSSESSG
jgi:hypothetical protein